MAVIQISRIQHRRGLEQDFPQLASAELGWSLDTQRLFIGNGTLAENAPAEGVTEILTEHSNLLTSALKYTFRGESAGYVIQTGPTANNPVVRTLQEKLDDVVSVKDFGAVGNGVDDDTAAIQRAIDRPVGNKLGALINFRHRTINFPAGAYRVTSSILIAPYTRLQGEGKTVSSIEGYGDFPVARFVDSHGQYGADFGYDLGGVYAKISEYHINDLQFYQKVITRDQPALEIDGCYTATFNRVAFRGLLDDLVGPDQAYEDTYLYDRGDSVAGIYIPNASSREACKDIKINQCDIFGINNGIVLQSSTHDISITGCLFDHCYRFIVIGQDPPPYEDYKPHAIDISGCYFRYSTREGILVNPGSHDVRSIGNNFSAAGQGTGQWSPPNFFLSPCITFRDENNWSIGDSFIRYNKQTNYNYTLSYDYYDYDSFPLVLTQGWEGTPNPNTYAWLKDYGIQNGQNTTVPGTDKLSLADQDTFTSAGLFSLPRTNNIDNLEMKYKVIHNNNTRRGMLRVSFNNGTISWDDEYQETGDTAFELNVVQGIGAVRGFDYFNVVRGTGYTWEADLTFIDNNVTVYGWVQGVSTSGGNGSGLIVDLMVHRDQSVVWAKIVDPGSGYMVGDVITIDGNGNGDAQFVVNAVDVLDIEYTSAATGDAAVLTYELNYFTFS